MESKVSFMSGLIIGLISTGYVAYQHQKTIDEFRMLTTVSIETINWISEEFVNLTQEEFKDQFAEKVLYLGMVNEDVKEKQKKRIAPSIRFERKK